MRMQRTRGNVFVGNLPTGFSEEQLAQVFDPFGIVLSATIARDPQTGKRLRHGFIDIATERAAKLAVAGLDGTEIEGRKLSVQISAGPTKKSGAPTNRRPPQRVARSAMPFSRTASEAPAPPAAPIVRKTPTFQVER